MQPNKVKKKKKIFFKGKNLAGRTRGQVRVKDDALVSKLGDETDCQPRRGISAERR